MHNLHPVAFAEDCSAIARLPSHLKVESDRDILATDVQVLQRAWMVVPSSISID